MAGVSADAGCRLLRAAVCCCCLTGGKLAAQTPQPLQDNSFLIEEAYNQAPGVVQEISNFVRSSGGGDWVYTFTQEWPLGGMRHQLSYTVPLEHHADFETTGLGDALLNYRYQARGMAGGPIYVAPRLSIVLPTGRAASGRGSGAWGLQGSLPVTVEVSPTLSTHWNAGLTLLPSAESVTGAQATTASFNAGASVIWLVRPLFNLMLETVWIREEDVAGPGATDRHTSAFLNPGFRWGFNFRGGLQVVTGLAYTVSLNDANPDALFLYLSFEHPFRRLTP
jgi:outer membrane putative beta-barrel porin/alpha-amylase